MHILSPETDNCPSWISGRERMTVENISWSISTKECCRPRRGLNPRPPGLQSDGASNWATEAGTTRGIVKIIWASAWQNQQNGMCSAKTQISLGIRPVWSDSSLSAWRKLGSLATYWVHSEDWSDWVDAQADLSLRWPHISFVGFVRAGSYLLSRKLVLERARLWSGLSLFCWCFSFTLTFNL